MSSRDDEPRLAMALTSLLALFLSVVPLPSWLLVVRPVFLMLAVIYWSLVAPRAGGIALGFLGGLALDVFKGAVLGQYALATSALAYLTIRQHLLLRNKPVFEQTIYVAIGLLLWEIVVWSIDGWTGHASGGWVRWVPVVTGSLCWPLITALFGRTHSAR
ncbi:MAG: rod shape-determining protein MreD [Steroidobacteraceae bacterium]